MTESTRLHVGDPAPAFSLTNDRGQTVALSDYAGRKVLVYFYPRANTPGCTAEACDFSEKLSDFENAGVDVIGISPDAPEALAKFRADHDLTIELLSDPEKTVMSEWGAYGEKQNYGKTVVGVIRSTFLVGADGTIEQLQYNVRASGHVERILRDWPV
ncbi:thioredoxin-dependent thiol peroxidase [Corynebacterium sanguinis]|uniref:thioredoxin-dependent thiol peroxidase n=1 Tax=Corynebacterium sanguinis TaxID=2594913 RepID=UPI0021AF79CE|nr:thioredoxin-dependent thiol peroxidase [Corynebacterium sanguinis]MCT1411392.1 thioredoxin-dependent thiol peroxidase [Corynebacterium sanguinis]MCT1444158.1 thioredoxin-dependent thiol peroxidase [Corynebacterium sanguinis]MCT1491701.1 thioredoxin-dependent thiol peroxidase [Corynebacterium sanguinis]MCT1499187.1 thioredoxin-dependent thiol peroxidase [Corynebacterium sanguinis]MCT1597215.1 thioredoxin-dependent thiol peroxidase [Corynebacterium sanguinis]